jgi:Helix-turn-helix.
MIKGSIIQEYIKKNKLTQQLLADKAGVSKPTINKMINFGTCDINSLVAVANAMNMSLDILCDRGELNNKHFLIGTNNQVGNHNVINAQQNTEIEHLKALLVEKERLIQVLIDNKKSI